MGSYFSYWSSKEYQSVLLEGCKRPAKICCFQVSVQRWNQQSEMFYRCCSLRIGILLILIHYMLFSTRPYTAKYSFFKFLIFFSISYNCFFLLSFMFNYKLFQGASSRWSAHRLREKFECKFDAMKAVKESQHVLFTGEVTGFEYF